MSDDDEAGPSTPRQSALTSLETPAPHVELETPAAPAPNPPRLTLPTETPANAHTPSLKASAAVADLDPYGSSNTASTDRPEHAQDHDPPGPPPFNFSGFLKDLRTKSAEPVARYLKSFLANFAKKPFTVNEQIKLIHDFLEFIEEKMQQCEPWSSQSSAEFDNSTEAMEKLVMNRLYNYTFTPQLVPTQPVTTDDLERDIVFAQRVRLFGWVREKHLDIPDGESSQGFLGFAEQELLKINHYKAPRDKMICLLNCCKVIYGLIRHESGAASSADAFVPILIFVVLRANPENLLSNVEYINRFRTPARLQGEPGYYLSSLTGAITFIESMDASSLSNITQEEFEENVEKAIQELPPSPTASRAAANINVSPFAPSTPGEEAARPLVLPSLDNTRKFIQRTGTQVQDAVSKPLEAIGRIFETMQDGVTTPRRQAEIPSTPDSPTRRFAALGLDSQPVSRSETPRAEPPEDDEVQNALNMSQDVYERTRRANVLTLRQMFPALDEDVVEAVLESCGDDLGTAIDTLLEM